MTVAVALISNPVNVTIQDDSINVTLSGLGPQGPAGPAGGGFNWQEATGNVTMAAGRGHVMNNASRLTATLPLNAALGDEFAVAGKGLGGWMIAQNSGQTIHVEGMATTTGMAGYIASQAYTDLVQLLCISTDTDFLVKFVTGNPIGN